MLLKLSHVQGYWYYVCHGCDEELWNIVDREGSVFQVGFHIQKASLTKIPNYYKTTVAINYICMDCRSLKSAFVYCP